MLTGIVYAMNPRRGMVAIKTEEYDFTIIELLGDDDIELGDEMRWKNDTGLGGETYLNVSKGRRMEVYVQNHWVPEKQLRQQLLVG